MAAINNSLRLKLGIGLAILLGLFVAVAVLPYWESRKVDQRIQTLAEVDISRNSIVHHIKSCVEDIGLAVVTSLRTNDPESFLLVTKCQEKFAQLKSEFRSFAKRPAEHAGLNELTAGLEEYSNLARDVIQLRDGRSYVTADVGRGFELFSENLQKQREFILRTDSYSTGSGKEKLDGLTAVISELTQLSLALDQDLLPSIDEWTSASQVLSEISTASLDSAMLDYLLLDLTESERREFKQAAFNMRDLVASRERLNNIDLAINLDSIGFIDYRDGLGSIIEESVRINDANRSSIVRDDLLSTTGRVKTVNLILAICGLVFVTGITVWIAKRITKPIGILVAAVESVSEGDKTTRVDIGSGDEFETLGAAFNRMVAVTQQSEKALQATAMEQWRLADENAVNAKLGRIITASLDLRKVYESFAAEVKKVINFDRLVVLSIDSVRDTVTYDFVSGFDVPSRRAGASVPYSTTFFAEDANTQLGTIEQYSENPEILKKSTTAAKLAASGIKSAMLVPLVSDDQVIGALSFSSLTDHYYSEVNLKMAQNIADQIAGAIANSSMYSNLEKAQTELILAQNSLESRVVQRTLELEKANEKTLNATLAKSQFMANMSHELRTPLNAVIGYSELLGIIASKDKNDSYIPDLDKITASGKHLLALVNDILDLGKVEAGKMDIYLEEIDVSKLVEETLTICQPLIEAQGNQLSVDCLPGMGAIRTDKMKLLQALSNLLSNAAKFTQNGEISLTVDREFKETAEFINFRVTDSGIGIPNGALIKIFKPFIQAESTIDRKYGGTGLGLTISRGFCQLMGGDITVFSEEGSGSTFVITLPTDGVGHQGSSISLAEAAFI